MRRLRLLTWHVHGSYLYYLAQTGHDFYIPGDVVREQPMQPDKNFDWPRNLIEVPRDRLPELELDAVVFQSRRNYELDQFELLTERQRRLPKIYIEHDPPRQNATDTRHWVDDCAVLLVHVTPFNALMWDSGRTPTRVIDHGVTVPEAVRYRGELPRGLAVVNNIARRGRRLGADVFREVSARVPVDLVGMGAEECGGLGEIPHRDLARVSADYRFFFNPIRYTSLGLAVCEAMMIGMPIVALATTEMATVVQNGVTGYADTRVDRLVERMDELLRDPEQARRLGANARDYARDRFNIDRFVRDWDDAFALVTNTARATLAPAARMGRTA